MRLPAWTLFGPAVATGLAAGAPGALVRTRWNHVTSDPRQLHSAFGAMSVRVVAATSQWGVRPATGFVLGAFSLASGASGFWYGTRAWASSLQARLAGGVTALAVFSSGLLFTESVLPLLCVGMLFGATVAPTFINGNSAVARIVPRHRLTEGLAWMGTGVGVGVSIGQSVSGQVIDRVGYRGGFVTVVCSAAIAAAIALAGLPFVRRALAAAPGEVSPHASADVG